MGPREWVKGRIGKAHVVPWRLVNKTSERDLGRVCAEAKLHQGILLTPHYTCPALDMWICFTKVHKEKPHPVCFSQAKPSAAEAQFKVDPDMKDLWSNCLPPGMEKGPIKPGVGACCLQLRLRWHFCSSGKESWVWESCGFCLGGFTDFGFHDVNNTESAYWEQMAQCM